MIEGPGAGSTSQTNGSGSGRPKNIWILRIRIRYTDYGLLVPRGLTSWSLTKIAGSGSGSVVTGTVCSTRTSRVYSRRGRPARGRRQPGEERVRGAKALEKESATTTAWITSSPRSSTFGPIFDNLLQDKGTLSNECCGSGMFSPGSWIQRSEFFPSWNY
jgi:hypothetical protein